VPFTAFLKMGGYLSKPEEPKIVIHKDIAKSVNIMIVGKPGIGKSTLINGLLGKDVAKVGHSEGVSRLLTPYEFEHNGITGIVYDPPGLLDSCLDENIIRQIQETFAKVDLLLLCIKFSDKFIEDDENNKIIRMLEEWLGKDMWRKTLGTLVFANELVSNLKMTLGDSQSAMERKFQEAKKRWDGILKIKLPGYCGVIPTGHINQAKLLESDKYHWLTNFWEKCYMSLHKECKKAALIQLNKGRFTNDVDVTIKEKIEDTRITITDYMLEDITIFATKFAITLTWLTFFLRTEKYYLPLNLKFSFVFVTFQCKVGICKITNNDYSF